MLVSLTAVLCVIGLAMVLSASFVTAIRQTGSGWYYFQRQVLWVLLGAAAMAGCARLDYRAWRSLGPPAVALAAALLVAVLVSGLGVSVDGSTRWLGVGPWRVQPSEFAKLALLVHCAALLARRADRVHDPRATLAPVAAVTGVLLGLVMLQPDMGTTLVAGGIVFSLLVAAGVPWARLAKLAAAAVAASVVLGLVEPYRRDRFLAFLHPWKDPQGIGYQAIQGQVALAEGGITGLGLGASRAKWGFLPNAHTDFILAIIGDEVGLIGTLAVVALFGAFAVYGIRTALRAPDRFGSLLAVGITTWVVGQAALNMGAVIRLLPITGVPLPFVSFGGSSLVVLMAAVGILCNIAAQGAGGRPGR
jgi:cell division protein FtsW